MTTKYLLEYLKRFALAKTLPYKFLQINPGFFLYPLGFFLFDR